MPARTPLAVRAALKSGPWHHCHSFDIAPRGRIAGEVALMPRNGLHHGMTA